MKTVITVKTNNGDAAFVLDSHMLPTSIRHHPFGGQIHHLVISYVEQNFTYAGNQADIEEAYRAAAYFLKKATAEESK